MSRWLAGYNRNIGAVLSVAIIFVITLTVANKQASNRFRESLEKPAGTNYSGVLGEMYKADGYTMSVDKLQAFPVDEVTAVKRYSGEISVTNTSSMTMQVAPGMQMFLVDSNGINYPVTTRYLAEGVVIGGPIEPGAGTKFQVDFDLPGDAVPRDFLYQKDITSKPQVIRL